ncbi:7-cyano-7-deazaguanine synthase [Leeuwenhoekiella palythoae]|uniref:7-cyano-7-deazaguanine synthase n=1 Tax=Leeuwenhoekiella palythoae TaxID=573501 RepID=A0A1M5ZCK4_9FLAO|nr:7-cyano-7-deazaguanine synthase [Leeuwenhoekiella palythoae]SHI21967.1 7-cyano-7-deazaguanine synthase [Leeuwenhoekiella palythoae]
MQKNNSAILLSGGMDSIALAYLKRPKYAFTLDYGQKAALAEINAARQVSKELSIDHHIIRVDCGSLGSGDMSSKPSISMSPVSEWWPYRNQLLVTLACMKGVVLGINELIVGSVKTDDAHKDGTMEFYSYLSTLVQYQEGAIKISCPAIDLTTIELIRKSKLPESLLLWAHSCHTSNEPCMNCNGCKKYLFTLQSLNLD